MIVNKIQPIYINQDDSFITHAVKKEGDENIYVLISRYATQDDIEIEVGLYDEESGTISTPQKEVTKEVVAHIQDIGGLDGYTWEEIQQLKYEAEAEGRTWEEIQQHKHKEEATV